LEAFHECYERMLPWSAFRPDYADLELMGRLVDLYLPVCHTFLGRVFLATPWSHVLGNLPETGKECISYFLPIMLKLIVKLSAEPALRQVQYV